MTNCLTCEPNATFFDWGGLDCTGSCGTPGQTDIPVDLCEFRGCCYNSSNASAAACFVKDFSLQAEFVRAEKTVITLMGTQGSGSEEYAARLWNGLVGQYYYGRWSRFFEYLLKCVSEGKPYDQQEWDAVRRPWQESWVRADLRFQTKPSGDAVSLSKDLFDSYRHLLPPSPPSY